MRASKVGLLGLAIAAAFAAGALAGPAANLGNEPHAPHVGGSQVTLPDATQTIIQVRSEIDQVLVGAGIQAAPRAELVGYLGGFVDSFREAEANGQLPATLTRDEFIDQKAGLRLREAGLGENDVNRVIGLLGQWISVPQPLRGSLFAGGEVRR